MLRSLEAQRLALSDLLPRSAYESLTRVFEADLEAVRRADRSAGVDVARFSHRLFNARWLSAKTARFALIGVVNRLDRAPFHADSCGETRLVYRLEYEISKHGTALSSRLPMTIGLEFRVPRLETDPHCREAVERWRVPSAERALAEHLVSEAGPLHASHLKTGAGDLLVVVNMQQIRWPSTVRPSLAGHAEYLLRAFRLDESGRSLKPAPLENTPDLARLKKDPTLLKELESWLREPKNLERIDAGTVSIPERFSASAAISVTPRGLGRRANRPFRQLFPASKFADLNFAGNRFVRSPEGLIRRLDQLSCQGCHEARSVAGFHLLGEDPKDTPAENSLAVAMSPHLIGDLPRRRAAMSSALGENPFEPAAPYAERAAGAEGDYGAHCGLGDPSFASWTCKPGLECAAYDAIEDGVGQCLPKVAGLAGDPCELGPVTQDADFRRDGVSRLRRSECAQGAVCNTNGVGFPGGMCTESCAELSADASCGSIAILDPFNACLARHEPFATCLTQNVRPAGLRACSSAKPCRDDYICAKTARGAACIPPYFLFQMRVDGHP